MSDQIIVIETGDAEAGAQVCYFVTLEEANRHIEERLESGCGRDSISPYRATRLKMQITHRPVVSLEDGNGVQIPAEYALDGQDGIDDGDQVPQLASNDYTPRSN